MPVSDVRPGRSASRRVRQRLSYLSRIASVYFLQRNGPLAFWYETPAVNDRAFGQRLDEYYMDFAGKAEYQGPFDADGVPLLDYRGTIGRQHNPIAIAQFGLANYNKYRRTATTARRRAFLRAADWLVDHLEPNRAAIPVWNHHFDWPYRETLVAPWYSGLAQGQGISLLIRAALDTGLEKYARSAVSAFEPFVRDVKMGGVVTRDAEGSLWIEEYLVDPPSHILNGFLWALWGVFDYARWTDDVRARLIFDECVVTLERNLSRYDTGGWSLYEFPDSGPPMLASPYYHRLHVVQLRIMYRLTGLEVFSHHAERWAAYARSPLRRWRALATKAWFKVRHY